MPEPQKRIYTARSWSPPGVEPRPLTHKSDSLARDQSRTALLIEVIAGQYLYASSRNYRYDVSKRDSGVTRYFSGGAKTRLQKIHDLFSSGSTKVSNFPLCRI